MSQLKNTKEVSTERYEEIEKLIEIARAKQLSIVGQEELLNKIRKGESALIEKLVDSSEVLILIIAQQVSTEMPIEELVAVGRKELTKLANQEVNSTARESYSRFGVWCVRQGMLRMVNGGG